MGKPGLVRFRASGFKVLRLLMGLDRFGGFYKGSSKA